MNLSIHLSLFLVCWLDGSTAARVLEIPGYFLRPTLRWEDLTGDGIQDIWLSDKSEEIWVYDGASKETQLRRLEYEPIGYEVKPAWVDGQWCVQAYDHGVLFRFFEDRGWQGVVDFNRLGKVRPGIQPIRLGRRLLVGTFDGNILLDGDCVLDSLQTLPSISLDAKKLKLTYPVPFVREAGEHGGEGVELFAAPVEFPQHGELGIWSARPDKTGWDGRWAKVQFPQNLKVERYATGDLNGDGFEDLVVLAMPSKDISIFEELSFIVYLGKAPGEWEPVPAQVLRSRQNLWQTGPIEVTPKGIALFYYKGLIRSHFKMDLFRWNPDGFIEPKPDSLKWTLENARGDVIILDFDVNGDGFRDLILSSARGVTAHFRDPSASGFSFREKPDRVLDGDGVLSPTLLGLQLARLEPGSYRLSSIVGRIRGDGHMALVKKSEGVGVSVWRLSQGLNGYWYLEEKP